MQFTDWIIILAIALASVVFLCSRHLAGSSLTDRARQMRGTRLLVLATISLWAALLTLERSLTSPDGVPFVSPPVALGLALLLTVAGGVSSIVGRRLLRQRRMFRAS